MLKMTLFTSKKDIICSFFIYMTYVKKVDWIKSYYISVTVIKASFHLTDSQVENCYPKAQLIGKKRGIVKKCKKGDERADVHQRLPCCSGLLGGRKWKKW